MNHYTSTHPRSPFTGQMIVQRTSDGVRHSLLRGRLSTESSDGQTSERTVPASELTQILADVFGIELDAEDSAELVRVHSAGE